jgi:NAD(P)H-nitrite reductase large subunit
MAAKQMHYAIIGGSAAGMAAADTIKAFDVDGKVTIFSEESDMPYFRPLIPFLISGKKQANDMALVGQGPYQNTDIDIRLQTKVIAVDNEAKTVTLAQGEKTAYDKLLIATGSKPYIPPEIDGTDAAGVFALRTLVDARKAAERAAETSHAVMLGGGLLNLKAAFALLERQLKVTLVVRSPEVLSQLMEPDDATLIRDALNRAGLEIKTGVSALQILSNDNGVNGVALDDGSEIGCEMICIGKGVNPNVDFLESNGIQIDKGVVVDRYTRCNAADVHAAGDVAVTFDPISGDRIVTGLWTNAVEMGRCAGFNMAGRPTEYGGTFGILNATQVAEEPFVSMGIVHTAGTDYEVYSTGSAKAYRKIVFSPDGNRLVGALLVGDIARAGLYRLVIRECMDVTHIKSHIINHSLHYGHFLKT